LYNAYLELLKNEIWNKIVLKRKKKKKKKKKEEKGVEE